ncbi:MAG: TRAP transporter small permease [Thermodesulfobacteriota bacterium]
MGSWNRLDAVIDRIEQFLLVLLSSLLILTAFLQIVLRNLFDTGLSWGDPLVRNLVLWVGFIGAALATREGKHINLEVVSRWVPPRGKRFIQTLTALFSSVVCALLTYASLKFVRNEAQMADPTFLRIPSWIPELILPVIFGLMALRFGFHALNNLSMGLRGTDSPSPGDRR